MPPLTIYKASAGSGKTFRLTLHYLELLFRDPGSYRNILAVTFTNKAASEMKSRILNRLHKLSILTEHDTSKDLEHLSDATGKSPIMIIREAQSLLVSILNDYSRFSVGTIDRFFQSVIRSFAREIGLPLGFTLELDRDRVLAEAVDRMFLRISDDEALRQWLMRFAESRLEQEQNWNFRNDIISLGKELFTESYQQMQMETGREVTRNELEAFIQSLDIIDRETRDRIEHKARETLGEMERYGWSLDTLPGKSRSPAAYFVKAASGERVTLTPGQKTAMYDRSKWLSKSISDPMLDELVDQILITSLKACYELSVIIRSVESVRPYIYTFGILNDIMTSIREITGERNLFLLSDAAYFLRGLVSNNPTPFIYEKTGNTFYHIMLDEFQDTSSFQWENFKPLLNHTLSIGKDNLVVGDIKQSIYRWRNSDWKILAEGVAEAFSGSEILSESLKENWRSREHIVRFNNDLFRYASSAVRDMINSEMKAAQVNEAFTERWSSLVETAYEEVRQAVPEVHAGSGGYVKCVVLESEDDSFEELALEQLPGWITELQLKGYRPGDIAILVRSNLEGERVAHRLMEHAGSEARHPDCSFDFVSNESLFIHRHPAIRFIVHLLTYINHPGDEMNRLHLKYFYTIVSDPTEIDTHRALDPEVTVSDMLPEWFTGQIGSIRRLPLYELVEKVILMFHLDRTVDALPYLQAFQEIILDQQRNEPVNLNDFLLYWQEHGIRKSLTVSEGQDAIRILTIHKAKGLQFKSVIVPFCRWSLTTEGRHETILWCRTENTLFSELPVLPVKYKNDLLETCFASDYLEERIMGYVDSLNLLYVALTRAEEALIVGIEELDHDKEPSGAGQLIKRALERKAVCSGAKDETMQYVDGAYLLGAPERKSSVDDPPAVSWKIGEYPVEISADRLRLRLKSADYFIRRSEGVERQVDFGNMMHELLRRVERSEDLERVVKEYHSRGFIDDPTRERLTGFLKEKLSGNRVRHWFTSEYRVINERDIINRSGDLYRPDRVMIGDRNAVVVDYKFGEEVEKAHQRQVRKYMNLLAEMDHEHIEGYIWYVMKDDIIKITE